MSFRLGILPMRFVLEGDRAALNRGIVFWQSATALLLIYCAAVVSPALFKCWTGPVRFVVAGERPRVARRDVNSYDADRIPM